METNVEVPVRIQAAHASLEADLAIPRGARGVVLFAHGSGSGRKSPRNRTVAADLQRRRFATLMLDLLSIDEEMKEAHTAHLRFDMRLLADRLLAAVDWLARDPRTSALHVGLFGASTGAGAALIAAAARPERIGAVVSRGGRPDLAEGALTSVRAPTLLLIGSEDRLVLGLNEVALRRIAAPEKELRMIPGATHLFEEPGALGEVARLAGDWFERHLCEQAAVTAAGATSRGV